MKTLLFLFTITAFWFLSSLQAQDIKTRKNIYNARYGEIIIVTGGPFQQTGNVYNTIGLNDCPEAAWKKLDPQKLKKEFHAHSVILNGPRYFLMDECSLKNPGRVVSFDGLKARFLAKVPIPFLSMLWGCSQPYIEKKVLRKTRYLFKKGNTLYELVSPQGTHYVMQSYAQIVNPKFTKADLATLGKKLYLPSGWRYEVHPLKKDYVMSTSGVAYVLQDDFKNTYQKK